MSDSPLTITLRQFEASEANLTKLEKLWSEIVSLTPQGIAFGGPPEYDDRCRAFESILAALPKIDGWKPADIPASLDDIGQWRLDAKEVGEISAVISVEREIEAPGRALREYRFRLNQKRRALIRDTLINLIDKIDAELRESRKNAAALQSRRYRTGNLICHHSRLRPRDRCSFGQQRATATTVAGTATSPPLWNGG